MFGRSVFLEEEQAAFRNRGRPLEIIPRYYNDLLQVGVGDPLLRARAGFHRRLLARLDRDLRELAGSGSNLS